MNISRFPKILTVLVAVAITGVFATACSPTTPLVLPVEDSVTEVTPDESLPTDEDVEEVVSQEPVTPGSATSTVALLEALPVNDEVQGNTYDREAFPYWSSKDGCDTRVAVLVRDGQNTTVNNCKVSGVWVSAYNGTQTTTSKDFDIDHMVPLKEAWVSGAYSWSTDTREQFANDMEYVYSLIAVDASSNRSKSDQDPTTWMPDTMDGCDYVARWVGVKSRWGLSVDKAEKDKILSVLSWCGGDYILPEVPVATVVVEGTVPVTPVEEPSNPGNVVPGADHPQFKSCAEAKRNGFKGPYIKGQDAEYEWYRDGDGDGQVCE